MARDRKKFKAGGGWARLSLEITVAEKEALQMAAAMRGSTMSGVLRNYIRQEDKILKKLAERIKDGKQRLKERREGDIARTNAAGDNSG